MKSGLTAVLALGVVAGMTVGSVTSAWGNANLKAWALGDRVWRDYDANGVQDEGEPGVQGVEVLLYASEAEATSLDDEPIASTTTDSEGFYCFEKLILTTFYEAAHNVYHPEYQVQFVLPPGYAFTVQTELDALGGELDSPDDSDADPTSGYTAIMHLSIKDAVFGGDPGWDAGLVLEGERLGPRTIGFWKNNIRKHMADRPKGTQVTREGLVAWLEDVRDETEWGDVFGVSDVISGLPAAYDPYEDYADALLEAAWDLLNPDDSSDIVAKTLQQLLACELNLVSWTYAAVGYVGPYGDHAALCTAAEDALNSVGGYDLHDIHDELDWVNNSGE